MIVLSHSRWGGGGGGSGGSGGRDITPASCGMPLYSNVISTLLAVS